MVVLTLTFERFKVVAKANIYGLDADEGLGPVMIDFETTDDDDEGRETTAGAESTANENEEEPSQAETARPQRQTIARQWQLNATPSTSRLIARSHTTADSTTSWKRRTQRTLRKRSWPATRWTCRRR